MQTSVPRTLPGALTTHQSPPFAVPMRYMLLGVIGFGVFAIDLLAGLVHVGRGELMSPAVVSLTHVLTLASLLSFVMGAVYQLSTVAFLVPLASLRVARWNFWAYLVGLVGFLPAMATWWTTGLVVFGTWTALSIAVYATNVAVTVHHAKSRGPMQWFVEAAHLYLILAVTVGVLLALATQSPGFARWTLELLATHIVLATGGFFTFLVMGFSMKLLPMFTLSHGWTDKRARSTFLFANTALWAWILGVWMHVEMLLWLGGLAGVVTFVLYVLDVRSIIRKRMRKKIEPPIQTAMVAAGTGTTGLLLVLLTLALHRGGTGWQAVVVFYLLGWIALTVIAYSYKIVPFLIWTRRYGKQAGKEKIPLISDIINLNQSRPVYIGFTAGFMLLAISTAWLWVPGALAGGGLVAVSVFVFSIQMLRVIDIPVAVKELSTDD